MPLTASDARLFQVDGAEALEVHVLPPVPVRSGSVTPMALGMWPPLKLDMGALF